MVQIKAARKDDLRSKSKMVLRFCAHSLDLLSAYLPPYKTVMARYKTVKARSRPDVRQSSQARSRPNIRQSRPDTYKTVKARFRPEPYKTVKARHSLNVLPANLTKGIQPPMVQGWSTKIISIMEWTRTSRSLIKNSLSAYLPPPRHHRC